MLCATATYNGFLTVFVLVPRTVIVNGNLLIGGYWHQALWFWSPVPGGLHTIYTVGASLPLTGPFTAPPTAHNLRRMEHYHRTRLGLPDRGAPGASLHHLTTPPTHLHAPCHRTFTALHLFWHAFPRGPPTCQPPPRPAHHFPTCHFRAAACPHTFYARDTRLTP